MEKYSLGLDLDLSHSNIEDFGVSLGTSIISRNIFKRADFLEFVVKGSIGSSKMLQQVMISLILLNLVLT